MILTFRIPWPDPSLMPNRKHGRHWGVTQKAKVSSRETAFWLTKDALRGTVMRFPERIPVRLTFYASNRRRMDLDGLHSACKAALDGIARALDVDDSRFRPVTLDASLDAAGVGFVLVEIGQ